MFLKIWQSVQNSFTEQVNTFEVKAEIRKLLSLEMGRNNENS